MPKVMFVNQFLPHYRAGVFDVLQGDADLESTFVADGELPGSDIATLDVSGIHDFRRVKNVWFGPFLWQRGVLSKVMWGGADAVVFVGDARYVSTWFTALALRMFTSKRVLFWTIGWHRPERGMKRVVRVCFYRLAHRLLIYGNVGKDVGSSMGYPSDRMSVIYNSLPSESTGDRNPDVARALAEIPADAHVVGAVIRLLDSKKLDVLLRAVDILRRRGSNVHVLLVGEGPARGSLLSLAESLSVPLSMPGATYSAQDMREIYSRLSATVVPGAVGLTAIQSLQFETPVITHADLYSQGPEVEAVRDQITGVLVKDASPSCIAEAIEQTLGQSPDVWAYNCANEIRERWTASASGGRIARVIKDEVGCARRR